MQNSLHFQLMVTQNTMLHQILTGAMQCGLDPGQPKILEYLSEHDGCQQLELARKCELNKSTITGIVKRMEAKGLIRREDNAEDARCVAVYLTEEGKKAVRQMETIFEETERKALRGISSQEQEQFMLILQRMHTNLNSEQKGRKF